METVQYVTKRPTDQWKNQRGNKKITRDKWQKNSKPMGLSKYNLTSQYKSQINNLTLHLKQLVKQEVTKPKVGKRKEIIKITAKNQWNRDKENNGKDQWT